MKYYILLGYMVAYIILVLTQNRILEIVLFMISAGITFLNIDRFRISRGLLWIIVGMLLTFLMLDYIFESYGSGYARWIVAIPVVAMMMYSLTSRERR